MPHTFNLMEPIPWDVLTDAKGTCQDYPKRLERLLSSSNNEVDNAYWTLENYAVVQGDLFPVAPYLVFKLVQSLKMDMSNYSRAKIYDLLIELVLGYSSQSIIVDDECLLLGDACKAIISKHFNLLEDDFGHSDHTVRVNLAQLILSLERLTEGDIIKLDRWRGIEISQKVIDILDEAFLELYK